MKQQERIMGGFGKYGFIGGGNMGGALIKGLIQSGLAVPTDIYIYEPDRQTAQELADQYRVNLVSNKQDLLKQAGVDRASAIIPCTENDLNNLAIALGARELKPEIHVVLRMFDHEMAQKVARGFNIPRAFSTSALAAPAFARAATRANITHAFYVGEHLINVSDMTIAPGSLLVGRQVCDLERELDFSIILYSRAGQIDLHPAPDITLHAGDQVCVLASLDVLNRLGRMNRLDRF